MTAKTTKTTNTRSRTPRARFERALDRMAASGCTNPNETGLTIVALVQAGVSRPAVIRAAKAVQKWK